MKRHIRFTILTLLFFALPLYAEAEDTGWVISIDGATSIDTDRVMAGIVPGATDSFDLGYDATSMFKSGTHFALYMDRADWGQKTPYAWIDITGSSLPYDWTFNVYTAEIGTAVDLGWNPSKVPASVNLELVDNYSGVTLDMKDVTAYSFTSVSASRGFTIRALSYIAYVDDGVDK